ncbi:2OG-Fe(II) oxygenase [Janthinobacterium agaricidamnosum]|uniref:2OG-Fe(II) oxygenase n=1 Tax=Janthinobacterium agaricidamnosum NBRC 102515 = DSM 9628 TaxID=1349767 RepID=W0V4T6_9BURK|nr:2OG-Fe(II) oxygenase [Janthinobacterium agaricidamnosum]CDG82886.1 2OG-Fe(II) oxygenase [Janthinobacterium agaricidamnosum NBRC 102515 = DSM 9628]
MPPLSSDAIGAALTLALTDGLTAHGWSQQNFFLPDDLTLELAAQCRLLQRAGGLTPAAVGRGAARAVQAGIRGDSIQWLTAGQSAACDRYLLLMESLRLALNRTLFLGLDDYESHFAWYAPGAFYARHLDRFRDDNKRTVSVVIYLNPDWQAGQGGALRLFPAGASALDIAPQGSRMVLFLSADMAHEVLPATRDRLSLAGWFRRR